MRNARLIFPRVRTVKHPLQATEPVELVSITVVVDPVHQTPWDRLLTFPMRMI